MRIRLELLMKYIPLLAIGLLGFSQLSPAQEPAKTETPSLALAERRAVKDYQEKILPELKKKLIEAAGFDVPLEIAWETIAIVGQSESYSSPDFWTNIYFVPLTDAFKSITKDDDGKTALKTKLKKIVIKHDPSKAPVSNYPNGITFEEGVLSINWTPYTNANDIEPRAKALLETIEPKL
jgi:hypothetical protein